MAKSIRFLLGSQASKNLKATSEGQVYFALDNSKQDATKATYNLYYDNGSTLIPVASESNYSEVAKYDVNNKEISAYGANLGITDSSTGGDVITLFDGTGKAISSVTTDEEVNQTKTTSGTFPLAFGCSTTEKNVVNGGINVNYTYRIDARTGELQGVVLDGGMWGYMKDPGCCFFPGTQILLSSFGLQKNIENLTPGEIVIAYDIHNDMFYEAKIKRVVVNTETTDIAVVTFKNGTQLHMNAYHPILTESGWSSLTNYNNYPLLKVGDKARDASLGWNEIVDIQRYTSNPITTYSLDIQDFNEQTDDDTNDAFIANGIVVHNAQCPT